jgi:hypothetical protein
MREQEVDHERRLSEAERQRVADRWPASSALQCLAAADKLRPCLNIEASGRAVKGVLTPFVVTWSGMPPGTRLEIWLESNAPVGDRWRYGDLGPIQLASGASEIAGLGLRNLAWNGEACPIRGRDVAITCRAVNPGHFRLGARATQWASNRLQMIGWAKSGVLQLEGAPDIAYLTRPWPALKGGLGLFLPRNFFFARPMQARRRGSEWCSTVAMPPPIVGSLDVCLPAKLVDAYGIRAKPEDLVYSGDYRLMPGLIAPDRAEIIAHRLARSLFEQQVDTTDLSNIFDYEEWLVKGMGLSRHSPEIRALKRLKWLESEVRGGIYRPANGGYWLFEVYERLHYFRYGEEGAPELPWETVLVKVERTGKSCVVARGDLSAHRSILNEAQWSPQEPAVQRKFAASGWDAPCSKRRTPTITR